MNLKFVSRNFKLNVLLVAITVSSLGQLLATSVDMLLQWKGENGYSMIADFRYDNSYDTIGPVVVVGGNRFAYGLLDLSYKVFDPLGALLESGVNVSGEEVLYDYFSFSYENDVKQFTPDSRLDIGEDKSYWLWAGFYNEPVYALTARLPELGLVKLDWGGNLSILSRDEPALITVSDEGSTLTLLSMVVGLVALHRLRAKTV